MALAPVTDPKILAQLDAGAGAETPTNLHGDDYLSALPAAHAAQVKALAAGRMAFPTGPSLKTPYWQSMLSDVATYDPDFDAVNYSARAHTRADFTSGKSSANIKALNTAIGHVGTLASQIDGTYSTNFVPFNAMANGIQKTFGGVGAKNYEQTAGAVAGELTQVYRNSGGAEADIRRYLEELNSDASDDQKKAALQNITGLLKSRLEAIGDQYKKGMGTTAEPLQILDQHAQEVIDKLTPKIATTPPHNYRVADGGGNPDRPTNWRVDGADTGGGDIGFADKAHMEANSLPEGAQEFQRDLSYAIADGTLKTPEDIIAFGAKSKGNGGRGFVIDPKEAQGAIDSIKKGGGFNVNTPQWQAPDISADRGQKGWDTAGLAESGKAFIRGIPNIVGADDELNAVADTFRGGTLRDNLAKERAIRDYDEQNHFWPRTAGTLATAFAIPTTAPDVALAAGVDTLRAGDGIVAARAAARGAFARRAATEGAGVAGAYGVGSSDGDLGDRAVSGLVGAGTGAAAAFGLTKLGQAAASRAPRLGRLLGIGGDEPPIPRSPGQQVKSAADRLSDVTGDQVKVLPADVGGTGTRMATGAVGSTLGGIPIADAKQASIATLGNARDAVAESAGAVRDTTGAGLALQRGVNTAMEGMQGREKVMHDVIPVDADRSVVLTHSRDALRYLTAELKSNPKLSAMFPNERLKGFLDALTPATKPIMKAPPVGSVAAQSGYKQVGTEVEGGTLSWEDMKRFRSIVGNMIGQASLSEDIPTANLRKFYGALSQDMEATAEAAGPKALDAWKKAQRYSRGMHDRIDNVFKEILGDTKDKGAQPAYERFEQWTKAKAGDQSKVGRLMRSLPADEADSARATFISRMGQARPGQQDQTGELFSPAEFVTRWNGMDRRAKAAMFNTPGLRSAMDDLATVASGMKSSSKYENFSRTAIGGNLTALAGAGFVSWPLAVVGSAASFGAGKLLSSEWMVRQLTKVASAETVQARQAAVAKFNSNLSRNPQFSSIAADLGKRMLSHVNDNGSLTAAASDQKKQTNGGNR